MRKLDFCLCKNKDADQLHSNCEADHTFVFASRIVQFLYFISPKFQALSHLLYLCSSVCVRPGRKPRRPVFSRRNLYNVFIHAVRCSISNALLLSFIVETVCQLHGSGKKNAQKFYKRCVRYDLDI